MKLMLEAGADMYATDKGFTAYELFAERLITSEADKKEHIANLKAANLPPQTYEVAIKQMETAGWLSKQDVIDVVNLYKSFNYDVNRQHEEIKRNLLFAATYAENYELLTAVISAGLADLTLKDGRGSTGSTVLATISEQDTTNRTASEYDALATLMVRRGAKVDDFSYMDTWQTATPLMFAAQQGFYNRCKTLLTLGASLKIENENKRTPLFFASDYKIMKFFIDNKANPLTKDKWQQTLLFYQKEVACIELLLSLGVKINDIDVDGNTALFEVREPAVVNYLISKGANINHVNNEKESILEYGVLQIIDAMRYDNDVQHMFIPKFEILVKKGIKQEHIDSAYSLVKRTAFVLDKLHDFFAPYVAKK